MSLLELIGFRSKTFSLLWRGSTDGFGSNTFHSLCDGKGETLTVTKTTAGYILGGYTAAAWKSSDSFSTDANAFMFFLTNVQNKPMKLMVTSPTRAARHHSNLGPSFGLNSNGYNGDLRIRHNSNLADDNWVRPVSFEFPDGKSGTNGGNWLLGNSKFTVADIEVFLIN